MQAWWGICTALALLFVACDAAPAPTVIRRSDWSASSAATLAAVVLLGPVGAAAVGASAVLSLRPLRITDRLFNAAMYALAGFAAGLAYASMSRWAEAAPGWSFASLLARRPDLAGIVVAPMLMAFVVAAVVHVLINYGAIRSRVRPHRAWQPAGHPAGSGTGTLALLASDLGLSSFGLFIAALWPALGYFAIGIVLVPLGVARWTMCQFAEQEEARAATLATFSHAVGIKDLYTRRHGDRVARNAGLIARQIGIGAARVEAVMVAGLLHDVGKLGVPTRVLAKDGPLTEEEAAAIQLHPSAGLTMVGEIEFLGEALSGIKHHHERMDGRGYPMGLAGDEIPEFARIIAVADAFDSMTSDRSYRKALDRSEALSELRKCAGSQFDPVMVEAFIAGLSRGESAAISG
jgi:HD domain